MLVSFNWLKQFVKLPDSVTPEEVADRLIMSTVEVEGVKKQGENLENIVIGKVVSEEKHSDADKLKVCKVDVGNEELQIVCGGSNVYAGMLVALAKVGAKVRWHGEGELVELQPAKIRGVESFGMICASSEIGLAEKFPVKNEKEILDLSFSKTKIGTPVAKALGLDDVIFEIDNKSMTNRPDLWGHYGLSREVAALYKKELKKYQPANIKPGKGLALKVKIEDTKLCRRYMGVAISGIKVVPSPDWLQARLLAVGQRPINNIVDITNYLMFELAQPMHAFDVRDLVGEKEDEVEIIVRHSKDGEKFTTLDGVERLLTAEMLVIADKEKTVALAGLMGGLNSEIKNDTTTIVYESANFDPTVVRKMSQTLGLRTEGSTRWEKNLDPNNAEFALKRAVELTLELCPGAKIVSQVVDESKFKLNQGPIVVSLQFINKKIGVELKGKEIKVILERLGFEVVFKNEVFSVKVPSWRATKDISIPEDIVEEVARIYGYGNIPTTLPIAPITPAVKNKLKDIEREIKEILVLEFGFSEVYNYSFLAPDLMNKIGLSLEDHLELANPIAKDRPYLRHNLWPNLLENAENNLHRFDKVKLFEIGKVFVGEKPGLRVSQNSDELLPRQDLMLAMVYAEKNVAVPFYELSEALSGLMKRLGYDFQLESAVNNEQKDLIAHHGRGATINVSGVVIGAIAELHPVAQHNLGIESRVASLEINLDKLLECQNKSLNYRRLSDYPEIVRDIAFVVDKKVEHANIVKKFKKVDSLIVNIELFDVYKGKNLSENKKSLAYHIIYQSRERTLTGEEVDKVHQKVLSVIEKEFSGEIRK